MAVDGTLDMRDMSSWLFNAFNLEANDFSYVCVSGDCSFMLRMTSRNCFRTSAVELDVPFSILIGCAAVRSFLSCFLVLSEKFELNESTTLTVNQLFHNCSALLLLPLISDGCLDK